jgi:hypothetical protein
MIPNQPLDKPRTPFVVLAICCCLALCSPAAAHETEKEEAAAAEDQDTEAENLAKAVQNPLANLITLPMQANFNDGVGATDERVFNLNIQPVIPIPGEKWNVITRTIIPLNSVPSQQFVGDDSSTFGLGDTSLSIFWSPAAATSLVWGVGPSITIPTASNPDILGSDKWSLGPTGVIFYGFGKWTVGAVASNIWSVAGNDDADDVNFFFAQWFLNYNFGKGWVLGTAPIITCDWEEEVAGHCTIPIGLQISRVVHIGQRPTNILVGYYDNVEHPVGGAESQARIQFNFIFPQKPKN